MKLDFIRQRLASRRRECEWCGTPLKRRDGETSQAWAHRRYCDREHAGLAMTYASPFDKALADRARATIQSIMSRGRALRSEIR